MEDANSSGGDQDVVKGQHLAQMQQQIPNARLMVLPANHGNYMMKDFDGQIDNGLIDFTVLQIQKFLEAE